MECRPRLTQAVLHEAGTLRRQLSLLFDPDPAEQVIPADPVQEGRMVGGHVPADHPDHLVIAVAAGDEAALASDQLHPRTSTLAVRPA